MPRDFILALYFSCQENAYSALTKVSAEACRLPFAPRLRHSALKVFRVEKDFCVPTPVVESAAYKFARRTASFSGKPSARKTAKLPMNASPAPELSTLLTENDGACSFAESVETKAPFSPSVMITPRMPPARRLWAHFFASSTLRTEIPEIVSASDSLGIR